MVDAWNSFMLEGRLSRSSYATLLAAPWNLIEARTKVTLRRRHWSNYLVIFQPTNFIVYLLQ